MNTIGPDRARYTVRALGEPIDEIEEYWSARYLSAGEAAWRIMGYHITRKDPSVTALPVHLSVSVLHRQYRRNNGTHDNSLSLLQRYFARPSGTFLGRDGIVRNFDDLTYAEYFSTFRLDSYNPAKAGQLNYFTETHLPGSTAVRMHVILRAANAPHVSRITPARPSEGERFYLRALLQSKSARSFEDLQCVEGTVYESYQLACAAHGLFADNNEGELALLEAIASLRTPRQLRILFGHLLVND